MPDIETANQHILADSGEAIVTTVSDDFQTRLITRSATPEKAFKQQPAGEDPPSNIILPKGSLPMFQAFSPLDH